MTVSLYECELRSMQSCDACLRVLRLARIGPLCYGEAQLHVRSETSNATAHADGNEDLESLEIGRGDSSRGENRFC